MRAAEGSARDGPRVRIKDEDEGRSGARAEWGGSRDNWTLNSMLGATDNDRRALREEGVAGKGSDQKQRMYCALHCSSIRRSYSN